MPTRSPGLSTPSPGLRSVYQCSPSKWRVDLHAPGRIADSVPEAEGTRRRTGRSDDVRRHRRDRHSLLRRSPGPCEPMAAGCSNRGATGRQNGQRLPASSSVSAGCRLVGVPRVPPGHEPPGGIDPFVRNMPSCAGLPRGLCCSPASGRLAPAPSRPRAGGRAGQGTCAGVPECTPDRPKHRGLVTVCGRLRWSRRPSEEGAAVPAPRTCPCGAPGAPSTAEAETGIT